MTLDRLDELVQLLISRSEDAKDPIAQFHLGLLLLRDLKAPGSSTSETGISVIKILLGNEDHCDPAQLNFSVSQSNLQTALAYDLIVSYLRRSASQGVVDACRQLANLLWDLSNDAKHIDSLSNNKSSDTSENFTNDIVENLRREALDWMGRAIELGGGPPSHFGTGESSSNDDLEIRLPSGDVPTLAGLMWTLGNWHWDLERTFHTRKKLKRDAQLELTVRVEDSVGPGDRDLATVPDLGDFITGGESIEHLSTVTEVGIPDHSVLELRESSRKRKRSVDVPGRVVGPDTRPSQGTYCELTDEQHRICGMRWWLAAAQYGYLQAAFAAMRVVKGNGLSKKEKTSHSWITASMKDIAMNCIKLAAKKNTDISAMRFLSEYYGTAALRSEREIKSARDERRCCAADTEVNGANNDEEGGGDCPADQFMTFSQMAADAGDLKSLLALSEVFRNGQRPFVAHRNAAAALRLYLQGTLNDKHEISENQGGLQVACFRAAAELLYFGDSGVSADAVHNSSDEPSKTELVTTDRRVGVVKKDKDASLSMLLAGIAHEPNDETASTLLMFVGNIFLTGDGTRNDIPNVPLALRCFAAAAFGRGIVPISGSLLDNTDGTGERDSIDFDEIIPAFSSDDDDSCNNENVNEAVIRALLALGDHFLVNGTNSDDSRELNNLAVRAYQHAALSSGILNRFSTSGISMGVDGSTFLSAKKYARCLWLGSGCESDKPKAKKHVQRLRFLQRIQQSESKNDNSSDGELSADFEMENLDDAVIEEFLLA
ncbi:hypothetical protein BJ742DRAFT_808803 [Cladochytrium replicatum]|nr:hypothetical protein BJ742DRAFT_808803 [Cladochytrium replicatum]